MAPELVQDRPAYVTSAADAPREFRRGVAKRAVRTHWFGLWAVIAAPVVANLAAIVGFVNYQPQARSSGIAKVLQKGIVPGQPFIDPNVGYNSYAVGHAAALSWLHGVVPWWNFNEGVGAPLAGSIQSGSFFPLTLMLALPDGSLWFHLALELLAGIATYLLLRELRLSPFASAAGAIAFGLNGSIAWVTNTPANPIPFLPVLILGVEWAWKATGARRSGGWILLSLGVWLTIVSGFPEVALFNLGLAVAWLVFRLLQRRRDALRVVMRAALAGGVGLLLAAPLLNAFVRAYRTGNLGLHQASLASISLPRVGLAQLVSPYVFGGIGDSSVPALKVLWGGVGGYTGVALLVLAIGGMFGARERLMRMLLAAWAIVFLGYIYDAPVLHPLIEHLPGLAHVAVYRYVTCSVLFCLCVLAAFCLDDLRTTRSRELVRRIAPGMAVVVVVFAIGFFSTPAARHWAHQHEPTLYWGSLAILAVTVAAFAVTTVVGARLGRGRGGSLACVVLGAILVVEATGFFEVPILAYPRQVVYDNSVVSYLRANLDDQRFFTVGPVGPNYGSFYGISSLDLSDLPAPSSWTTFVHDELSPCILPWQLGSPSPPWCLSAIFEFVAHEPAYASAGVKYLVVGAKYKLSTFEQPRYGAGPRTAAGATTMTLRLRPPSFYPGGVITAFTIQLQGQPPPTLTATACSAAPVRCVAATAAASSKRMVPFTLASPLTLNGSLTITIRASPAAHLVLLTAPSSLPDPSTVASDGAVLADRSAILRYAYVPASLPRLVHSSSSAKVYELPRYSPIATAPGCVVTQHSKATFTAQCSHASTLTYRELSDPGWTATVMGRAASITTVRHLFQSVPLPAGRSAVSFTYEPPFSPLAWVAALLGVLAIFLALVRRRVEVVRGRTRLFETGHRDIPGANGGQPPRRSRRTSLRGQHALRR